MFTGPAYNHPPPAHRQDGGQCWLGGAEGGSPHGQHQGQRLEAGKMLKPLRSSCCTTSGGPIHTVTHVNSNLESCAVHNLCSTMQHLVLPILKNVLI